MHRVGIYGVEDGKAGTGSLITGDVFSEQIANMKDLGSFICQTEAPAQVF